MASVTQALLRVAPLALLAMLLVSAAPIAAATGEEVVVVASHKYFKNPNPMKQETWYDWWLNIMTFDSLFREGPTLDPVPWLCKRYEVSPDGRVWTFVIVDNAYWHDGVKLTAWDIAFTIDFFKKYKPPDWYPDVKFIDRYEVVNDYTIKIYLKEPFVWVKRRFGYMIILPAHIWKHVPEVFKDPMRFDPLNPDHVAKVLNVIKAEEPAPVASKVEEFVKKYKHLRIGSGPFILSRWKEGELWELVKFPLYFKKGFPRADKLVFKVYKTAEAEYLAVKKGEAHIMMWTVPYAVVKEAEKDPHIVLPKTPDVYIGYIGLNMNHTILGNKLVRQAIAYILDKDYIVKVLMLGYADPVYTYVHPGYEKWVNFEVPEYDHGNLEKAKELLDEAGLKDVDGDGWRELPDGTEVKLTVLTPSYDPVRVRIGDLMVEWFKKVGIKLENRPVDFDTLVDQVYNKHEFDMYIIEDTSPFEPWSYSSVYTKEQYVPGGNNPWGFVNKEFEELLAKVETTIDEAKRVELYKKLQEMLADEVPLIPVYTRYWMQAYRAELSGVVEMPGGALNFWTLINANFRGLKPEIPVTKLEKPATPTATPATPTATPAPTATVVAKTVTTTVTHTVTTTITTTVEKTVTSIVKVTEWSTTAAAAIVMLIIGLAVGYVLKRR